MIAGLSAGASLAAAIVLIVMAPEKYGPIYSIAIGGLLGYGLIVFGIFFEEAAR